MQPQGSLQQCSDRLGHDSYWRAIEMMEPKQVPHYFTRTTSAFPTANGYIVLVDLQQDACMTL